VDVALLLVGAFIVGSLLGAGGVALVSVVHTRREEFLEDSWAP
jgi:hypothetical protein